MSDSHLHALTQLCGVQSLNSLGMAAAVEALHVLDRDAKKLPQAAQAGTIHILIEALSDLGTSFARPGVLRDHSSREQSSAAAAISWRAYEDGGKRSLCILAEGAQRCDGCPCAFSN